MGISEQIHNFNEFLVAEQLRDLKQLNELNDEQKLDLYCIVLNRLPARYVRHDVDALSSLSDEQRQHLQENIAIEINDALDFLLRDRRQEARDS